MTDVFDQAQEHDELFRQNALAEHYRKRKITAPLKMKVLITERKCADCGEPIPKED